LGRFKENPRWHQSEFSWIIRCPASYGEACWLESGLEVTSVDFFFFFFLFIPRGSSLLPNICLADSRVTTAKQICVIGFTSSTTGVPDSKSPVFKSHSPAFSTRRSWISWRRNLSSSGGSATQHLPRHFFCITKHPCLA